MKGAPPPVVFWLEPQIPIHRAGAVAFQGSAAVSHTIEPLQRTIILDGVLICAGNDDLKTLSL